MSLDYIAYLLLQGGKGAEDVCLEMGVDLSSEDFDFPLEYSGQSSADTERGECSMTGTSTGQLTSNIRSIAILDEEMEMCDIEVDEVHCYYGNGVVTHNSAQELRITANISKEPVWADAFIEGRDVHRSTAESLWGPENYNKDLRKRAKGVNFGVIYGMGAPSMIDPKYGIHTLADAEAFFEQYKSALPTLFQWIDRVQRAAKRNGTVSTFFGRPRRVKGYYDAHNAGFANRTATNTQIQGTAGDILKIVMCKLWKDMLDNPEYRDDVRFMITIHDEIGYSVRSTRAEEIIKLIEDTQTFEIPQWPIPLICEASFGWSVGSLFAVERVDDPTRPHGYTYRPKLDS